MQNTINMQNIPRVNAFTALGGLVSKGYMLISNECRKLDSDIFTTRLPGLTVICFRGEAAAGAFYDEGLFVRKGAVPLPVQLTLTGKDAVHTTDGKVHMERKQLFLALMTDANISRLVALFHQELDQAWPRWISEKKINVFDEMTMALCKVVCAWCGVPLPEEDARRRAGDFVKMIDAFGSVGLRNLRGRFARLRTEKWIRRVIRDYRAGNLQAGGDTALAVMAQIANEKMAAIELINILRPTVAIGWYMSFTFLALHGHPQYRHRMSDKEFRERFINEVRRFYPFAPFMGAKCKQTFNWQGYTIPVGALVLLDLYGTNHDERLWPDPYQFKPDRFEDRAIKPFDFMPQGGGYPAGHRCPGEWITVELLDAVLRFFTGQASYDLPAQDTAFRLSRMPALPGKGLNINLLAVQA